MAARHARPVPWPMLLIGAVLLALLAASVAIAGLPLVGSADGSPIPSASSGTPTSTPSDSAPAAPNGPQELAGAVWWALGWQPLQGGGERNWNELTVGFLDGTLLDTVPITGSSTAPGNGAPFVEGPSRGLLLYATDTGPATELHVVDAAQQTNLLVASIRAAIHDAALSPEAGVAYYAAGSPLAGIWRVPLDGSGVPELVLQPAEVVGLHVDAMLVPGVDQLPKQVTLAVDPAEDRLAMFACTMTCTLRIVGLPSLEQEVFVADLEPSHRSITDFTEEALIIETEAYDPDTGAHLGLAPDDLRRLAFANVGYELPAGWRMEIRLVNPNAMVVGVTRYVAIDPTGAEFPLDFMGPGPGQG